LGCKTEILRSAQNDKVGAIVAAPPVPAFLSLGAERSVSSCKRILMGGRPVSNRPLHRKITLAED
jgi:hypothetical protein